MVAGRDDRSGSARDPPATGPSRWRRGTPCGLHHSDRRQRGARVSARESPRADQKAATCTNVFALAVNKFGRFHDVTRAKGRADLSAQPAMNDVRTGDEDADRHADHIGAQRSQQARTLSTHARPGERISGRRSGAPGGVARRMTSRTEAAIASTASAAKTSIPSRAGMYSEATPRPTMGTERPT